MADLRLPDVAPSKELLRLSRALQEEPLGPNAHRDTARIRELLSKALEPFADTLRDHAGIGGQRLLAVSAHDVPLELLGVDGEPWTTGGRELVRCFGSRLRVKAMPPEGGRLRVAIVVLDQTQDPGCANAEPDAADCVRAIRGAVKGLPLDLDVLVPAGMLRWLRGLRGLTKIESEEALRQRLHAAHVIHFLGRSNAPAGAPGGASALLLAPDWALDGATLTRWLRGGPTRLIVLNACDARGRLAEPLLRAVDHVVGMAAFVEPPFCTAWCRAFYEALSEHSSVGAAVSRARERIRAPVAKDAERYWTLDWVPAHWTRTRVDAPFADAEALAIEAYCAAVARRHKDLHGKLLDPRYRAAAEHTPVPVSIADRRKARAIEQQGSLRVPDLLRLGPGRFTLLGEAGSGKTVALRYLARCLAQDRARRWVPCCVGLRRFEDSVKVWTLAALLRFVLADAGVDASREADVLAALDARVRAGKVAFLLDGWDELTDAGRESTRLLLEQIRASKGCPILLTSRPVGVAEPDPSLERAEILPLGSDLQERLLGDYFRLTEQPDPRALAREALHAIEQSWSVAQLARWPLFLTLIARQWSLGKKDIPGQRHRFLEGLVDAMLSVEHERRAAEKLGKADTVTWVDEAKDVLGHLATTMTHALALSTPHATLLQWLGEEPARGVVQPLWHNARSFLNHVGRETGILAPEHPGEDAPWRFAHRSFQELLTARALSGLDAQARQSFVKGVAESQDGPSDQRVRFWTEPLALVAGYLEDGADAWVRDLVAGEATREIGLKAVAIADTLEEGTLRAVLDGCANAGERAQVYASLGDRFGRGSDTVALLEARAGRAGDAGQEPWEELWHIDEALRRIGTGSAADARPRIVVAASQRRGSGEPSLDALRKAFSHVPGTSEAWLRRIPKGSFLMGSPTHEEGRYGDEGPFRARIAQPYWISVTTVTLAQYRLFDPSHRQRFDSNPLLPVTEVNWFAATIWCRWATAQLARGLHLPGLEKAEQGTRWVVELPSEMEWEYAARAWQKGFKAAPPYSCGKQLPEEHARFGKESEAGPRAAHEGSPNGFGLRNVHGNVWEWCRSWYGAYPVTIADEVVEGWEGPASGSGRVQRGGSCGLDARWCRSAYRFDFVPDVVWDAGGFRVVVRPEPIDLRS